MSQGSNAHIIQSLAANLAIAVAKGIVAAITGSGALLAETIHSFADCGNQILLLIGVRNARRPPSAQHPLGYGRDVYFWSFMVAMLLFTAGGVFSLYEGLHKIVTPEKVQKVWLGMAILLFSLVIEGWATIGNVKELNKRRGQTPFLRYLRDTKDSDLIVVFGENSAAVVGLLFALAALGMAALTGDGHWDGAGSVAVGVVLVGVALFLAREVKSLLLGERADPDIDAEVRKVAGETEGVAEVLNVITIQQGPGEVLVAAKLRFHPELDANGLCHAINRFEIALRSRRGEVRWCFVEPDLMA